MAIRKGGPTDSVITYAKTRPGSIISRGEAKRAYCLGRVPSCDRPGVLVGGKGHPMSVGHVLRRHFTLVEGSRPQLYVLNSSMENPDAEHDRLELLSFNSLYGCDEYGRSTCRPLYERMSAIPGEGDK